MPNFFAQNTSEYVSFSRKARNSGKLSANIFLVETIPENIIDNSKGAAKGVSEEEGDMVSMVALDNLDGLFFKGSSTELFPFLFIYITLHYITTFQPDVGNREHIQQYNITLI